MNVARYSQLFIPTLKAAPAEAHRARRAAQLSAAAAGLVPDPDQVPRRAPAQVGPAPPPPVHDEGLLGIQLRVTVGKKGLAEGKVEWKLRRRKELELVPLAEVGARAKVLLAAEVK